MTERKYFDLALFVLTEKRNALWTFFPREGQSAFPRLDGWY
nr:MAG TPA_asm: hypothetical protein [Caudoviricetes sp.]DAW60260.1 MAG TPA: hypothetical protein [Caudoviricetes sp.]